MPTLSSSNRTQARYKLEGLYPTNFGTLIAAGNGTKISMTGESFNFDIKTEMSKNLRSDRGITGHTQVGASAAGDLNVEHIYREHDWAMESILGNQFVAYGTDGVGASIATLTAADLVLPLTKLTAGIAPSGGSALTELHVGQWFTIIPEVAASAAVKAYLKGRAFRVLTVDSDEVFLDPATPIDTTIITAPLTNAKLASSRLYTGTSMWSYNIEMGHEDISRFRQYLGMIPGKLNWKLSVGSIVSGSIGFMGKSMVSPLATATSMGTSAEAQPFTSANATRGVFDILEGGVSISATTYIKSADITVDGSLRMQDAVGVFGAAGIASGTFKISGTLELYFADSVIYNKFLAGGATSLSIPILDVDGNGYVYYFPNFIYSSAKVNAAGLDQDNSLSLTFECDFDNVPTSATYQKMMAIYRVGAARAV